MSKLTFSLAAAVLLFFAPQGGAQPGALSLTDAVNNALVYSPRLNGLKAEQKAFEARAASQKALLYPKLFLDGSYRYVTEVQEIAVPLPGVAPIRFGDNYSYSFGPALSWTAWDSGNLKNAYKSASAAAQAKELETRSASRQVVLAARSAYFQVALAGEQAALYADALKLANTQYEDIRLNARAGTKSRADELSAHQEVLTRTKQLRQARSELASALRELSAVTGKDHAGVTLESIDALLTQLGPYAVSKLNTGDPGLAALDKYSEAAGYSRRSAASAYWPRLQLSARSTVDYPNGNVLENFNQNTAGAALSWTLFEGGGAADRVSEQENYLKAYRERRLQLESDLKRDWDKAQEQFSSLKDQQQLNDIAVSETSELAGIIYKAYRTGSASFIELENANFKALEAKIQSARTKVQMLLKLAALAGMAE